MYLYRLFTMGGSPSREGLLNVAGFLVALVTALVLHEIAHGLVALWNGDPTAKQLGRLSVNPIRHFDLIGFVLMVFVGFGWARPVPVNPNNFKRRKLGVITVSVAGILTNLLLAFLFALPYALSYWALGNVVVNSSKYYLLYFVYVLCAQMVMLNVFFALFNILPLFPLDGYRLLAGFIGEENKFMRFLRRYSLYIMLFLILWDTICDIVPALNLCSPLYWYISWIGGRIANGFLAFWGLIL